MGLKILFYFMYIITFTIADVDWTNECNVCRCTWVSGRKAANCANQNLTEIPKDLSSTIKDIDFSNNEMYSLNGYELSHANLRDVNKLKFQNCSIEQLSESAFFDLFLLSELDLSKNRIIVLSRNVFRHNVNLRILILSYNNISDLDDGIFFNMTLLQRILLDNNQIQVISPDTFKKLPSLNHIDLSYNRIKRITFDLKQNLPKLNSLYIEGNPWTCDCYLEEFRQIAVQNNFITNSVKCHEPPRLQGEMWLDPIVFACIPVIVDPKTSTQVKLVYSNITLICKAKGQPIPEIEWTINGHTIENGTENNLQKYVILENVTDNYIWSILTIMNINFRDIGDYKCVAKNSGGEDERNITLVVPPGYQIAGEGNIEGKKAADVLTSSAFWVIGFSIGIALTLIIALIFVCCFCRKVIRDSRTKQEELTDDSEAYINMHDINPVKKPARSIVPPSSNDSADTELTEVKRNLLDDEAFIDDYGEPITDDTMKPFPNNTFNTNYPADLPEFQTRTPLRSVESPASSFASTTPLVYHRDPQNPFRVPSYDQLDVYRTLPSFQHNPTSAYYQPIIPKQGYITIPRRPRQRNWITPTSNSANMDADLL